MDVRGWCALFFFTLFLLLSTARARTSYERPAKGVYFLSACAFRKYDCVVSKYECGKGIAKA